LKKGIVGLPMASILIAMILEAIGFEAFDLSIMVQK